MSKKFILIIFTFLIFLASCVSTETDPQKLGLYTPAELEVYFDVPQNTDVNAKYVTHFAKSNLKQGNSVVIGAVSSVNYDMPNSQRGTLEIFRNLWGVKLKKQVNVYSSELGFLEACTGEQLFVLRAFAGGNNTKIVTNFQLDPRIREHQISTTLEILKIEENENFLLRKKELVEKYQTDAPKLS